MIFGGMICITMPLAGLMPGQSDRAEGNLSFSFSPPGLVFEQSTALLEPVPRSCSLGEAALVFVRRVCAHAFRQARIPKLAAIQCMSFHCGCAYTG